MMTAFSVVNFLLMDIGKIEMFDFMDAPPIALLPPSAPLLATC